jgi:hypothetical protein
LVAAWCLLPPHAVSASASAQHMTKTIRRIDKVCRYIACRAWILSSIGGCVSKR